MKTRGILSTTAILMVFVIGGSSASRAQHHGHHEPTTQHQHMMMQDQMLQMHTMAQHMAHMTERSRELSQTLGHMMDRHHGSMRDHIGMMQQMCESIATMAEHMKTNTERCVQLMQDETLSGDQEIRTKMEDLRRYMGDMTEPMEGAIKSLEKMTRRLEQENVGD